jgi:hypothetical protein
MLHPYLKIFVSILQLHSFLACTNAVSSFVTTAFCAAVCFYPNWSVSFWILISLSISDFTLFAIPDSLFSNDFIF